jgi:hypothetical protein
MADKTLVMTFLNQEGTRTTLTLPAVRDNITEAEVITAMDTVIAANIFYSAGGSLVTKHSAQVNERTVTELDVR